MAKKTPMQRALQESGIMPFAPVRLARTGGWVNAASSILLGKDFENNFDGAKAGYSNSIADQGTRFDVLWRWQQPGTFGDKLAITGKIWLHHAIGSFSNLGFKRSIAPALGGEIAFQVAKGMKANKIVPAGLRKVLRVY